MIIISKTESVDHHSTNIRMVSILYRTVCQCDRTFSISINMIYTSIYTVRVGDKL